MSLRNFAETWGWLFDQTHGALAMVLPLWGVVAFFGQNLDRYIHELYNGPTDWD